MTLQLVKTFSCEKGYYRLLETTNSDASGSWDELWWYFSPEENPPKNIFSTITDSSGEFLMIVSGPYRHQASGLPVRHRSSLADGKAGKEHYLLLEWLLAGGWKALLKFDEESKNKDTEEGALTKYLPGMAVCALVIARSRVTRYLVEIFRNQIPEKELAALARQIVELLPKTTWPPNERDRTAGGGPTKEELETAVAALTDCLQLIGNI